MKRILTSITFVLLVISSVISANTNDWFKKPGVHYHETPTPGKFLLQWMDQQSLTKNTLILLDLDDTVFSTPADNWIRPNIYYNIRQEQARKHPELTPAEAGYRANPLLFFAVLSLPYQLTDQQLPSAIETLKNRGFSVFGFTSRERSIIPETLKTLQKLNIHFSQVPDYQLDMGKNKHPLIMKDGIIFAGNANEKGAALTVLLDSGKLKKPDTIVFIDDRMNHLKTTTTAIVNRKKSITFFPVLCTYPEVAFKPYEAKPVARALLGFLLDNIGKRKEAITLLDSDAYTQELVAEQCGKQPDKESLPLCKKLKTKYCNQLRKENSPVCKGIVITAR